MSMQIEADKCKFPEMKDLLLTYNADLATRIVIYNNFARTGIARVCQT